MQIEVNLSIFFKNPTGYIGSNPIWMIYMDNKIQLKTYKKVSSFGVIINLLFKIVMM